MISEQEAVWRKRPFCRSRLYEILPMIVISEDAYALSSGGAVIGGCPKKVSGSFVESVLLDAL